MENENNNDNFNFNPPQMPAIVTYTAAATSAAALVAYGLIIASAVKYLWFSDK